MIRRIALGLLAAFCLVTFVPIKGCEVSLGRSTWTVGSGQSLHPAAEDYEPKQGESSYRFRGSSAAVLNLSGTALGQGLAEGLTDALRSVAQHLETDCIDVSHAFYRPEGGWLPDLLVLSDIKSSNGTLHVIKSQDHVAMSIALGRAPIRLAGYRQGPWSDARAEWNFDIHRDFTGLRSPAARQEQIVWNATREWRKYARKLEWPKPLEQAAPSPTSLEIPAFPFEGDDKFSSRVIYTGRRADGRQETLWIVTSPLGFYDAREELARACQASGWTAEGSRRSDYERFVGGAFRRGEDEERESLHVTSFWRQSSVREQDASPEPIALLHASTPR